VTLVTDQIAGVQFLDRPGRREAASSHGFVSHSYAQTVVLCGGVGDDAMHSRLRRHRHSNRRGDSCCFAQSTMTKGTGSGGRAQATVVQISKAVGRWSQRLCLRPHVPLSWAAIVVVEPAVDRRTVRQAQQRDDVDFVPLSPPIFFGPALNGPRSELSRLNVLLHVSIARPHNRAQNVAKCTAKTCSDQHSDSGPHNGATSLRPSRQNA
jgi:hypothetical protein